MSRLYLRIWLGFVVIAMLSAITAAVTAFATADEWARPPELDGAIALILETVPPPDAPAFQQRLDHVAATLDADIVLRDDAGRRVGASSLPPRRRDERWGGRPRRALTAPHPDGGSVDFAPRHRAPRPHGTFPWVVLALLGAMALGAWPVARSITSRLESVRSALDAWGHGDLQTRAPVEGSDEVAGVATAFNQAADRVAALVDHQRRVLASTSHELRSPLARLRMALTLLEDDDPERTALINRAQRDITELDTTVGELLRVGRLQAVGLDRVEPVDLHALASELAPLYEATVEGPAMTVQGDPHLLRRLLTNLLDNARTHGEAPIRIRLAPHGLSVCDAGPGVPAEEREAVFEAFHRHAHDEGGAEGTGLGLWLVREIARAHGGDARFGEGGEVVVRLG